MCIFTVCVCCSTYHFVMSQAKADFKKAQTNKTPEGSLYEAAENGDVEARIAARHTNTLARTHSLTHSSTLTHSLTLSRTLTSPHPSPTTHPPHTHTLTHSLIHSLIHSFTHLSK